ncbi:Paraquat-inducible protein B [Izhakiella capsodis]|uniref:Paraquat-inducible protein B n=1 Tax=Izhakiella capsodis TaxID=1367852 RepID=A0A1I4ZBY7_9GAMM|nr:PqiB family protein [Izhakiella capsodis]SFN47718.1 Paraquat-inducible protein B [Izhakiella capsodis]
MQQETPNTPIEARIRYRRKISPFWLLPLIAVLIAGWLLWTNYQERGTSVTIIFNSADGIVPGRTPIRYQGVEIGTVQGINLSDDLRTIRIKASIKNDMKGALRENTQFWLVTPKASLAGVSGLDALVGGNYIGMMPGKGQPRTDFIALDTQPKYRMNTGEMLIHLHAPDLGSLGTGSLVYYRKIPVGRVYDYSVNPTTQGVTIDVLIERRFTNLVKKESRFWNVSGFKADLNLNAPKIQMESISALVNGAVAFDSPPSSPQAKSEDNYPLYPDLQHSERGVNITLDLPNGKGLKADATPLVYQGLQVGTLSAMQLQDSGRVKGELLIDPSVVGLMRKNTRIALHMPKLRLSDASISNLLTGPTLELIPGDGTPVDHFSVAAVNDAPLQQPNVLKLTLNASDSYGISAGQPIKLHGMTIGQVVSRSLTEKGVSFAIAIDADYRHLVHRDSKFIVNSRLDVKFGLEGVQVLAASAREWVDGGIRLEPGDKGSPAASYPLYGDSAKAEEGITGDQPPTTLTLIANSLPDIQAGSVVLYRKFQVGEIVSVTPYANKFDIGVYIRPEYRKLLTRNSVFWAEGGAKVQWNGSGLTVKASPLNRALKGAISFDNLSGASADIGDNQKRALYASETAARAVGSQIILRTYDGAKLSPGMPIRYLGISVGQVENLALSPDNRQIVAKAVLYPEYVDEFARWGSQFSVVSPQISAAGVSHLETLLQPYINVDPGKGRVMRSFELQENTITDARYIDGLNVIVDTNEGGSLQVGTPVFFRGVEVGTVTGTTLGSMADRVLVFLRISSKYQHLVRNNSVFWLSSGYNLKFGLIGGVVKTGTFQQFIQGGISFATPPTVPLAPQATPGKHFLLENEEPKGWRNWGTAIPQPR